MFFYLSLLVELHYFDDISMQFLIVGHTHSTIDQFFSVLCKAIERARFIGTPISLHELYSTCSTQNRIRPKFSDKFTWNMTTFQLFSHTWTNPFTFIKFLTASSFGESQCLLCLFENWPCLPPHHTHPLPFFTYCIPSRHFGKAIMQYKLYVDNEKWLPEMPDIDQADIMKN